MVEMVAPDVSPALPAGFEENHDIKKPHTDASKFRDQRRVYEVVGIAVRGDEEGYREA